MPNFKPRVICLAKRPNETFGFSLRVEQGEEGHLIRCLELEGSAIRAGMKDGDRLIRVNGTFVDTLPHTEVVEIVKSSGTSVTFHLLDESSYKQAKAQGVNFADPKRPSAASGVVRQDSKPKLCYLVRTKSGFGFSLRSVNGERGVFMTEVTPGGAADRAGVKEEDRLIEINGENIEILTHDQVVDRMKAAGETIMLLLVDKETDGLYHSKHGRIHAESATATYLPHTPRIINITRGSDGYGFLLRKEPNMNGKAIISVSTVYYAYKSTTPISGFYVLVTWALSFAGHFIKDIDKGSPAERAGLQDKDRVVAVDGKEVESCSHDQVVDRIKKSGNSCCLLVVDRETDKMYKKGKVSPIIFLADMKYSPPPSYTEALTLSTPIRPSTPVSEEEEELQPKLCKLRRASAGYGFHLNGVQGVCGQYLHEVVKGGAADKAGLENDDIVVEVNGVNVEKSTHDEAVELIRKSGDTLVMLVAKRSVYDKLKAKGVTITPALLEKTSRAQVHNAETPEATRKDIQEEARAETPTEPERQRSSSVSSSSSEDSEDERF
ncbi:Na(+)/H(+) exchange regulatory cofactor NHE-RF3 [Pholidichthys leucotaenia]